MKSSDPYEMLLLQKAVEDQNAMLYQMLEKVNEDRQRRI